jgi:hypothetical protein
MVTQAINDFELLDEFSNEHFERMPRRSNLRMPSNKSRAAKRAAIRTPASRRAAHHSSHRDGGMHRRRRHVWQ